MIKIENLSYQIDDVQILSDITMDIPRGGITALVGANGAGKSTLLSLVARLLPIQKGRITVDDLQVGQCPSDVLAQRLAILPQSDTIAPRLTIRELVGFGRYPYHKGRPKPDDLRKVAEAISVFELDGLADRQLDSLSGGQRQRALIAMAYAQDTDYLLLDEPLNNLDIAASQALMRQLRDLSHNKGRTIVIVMHDLNIASSYADHMIALCGGRIGATGAPTDIVNEDMIRSVFNSEAEVLRIGSTPVVRI